MVEPLCLREGLGDQVAVDAVISDDQETDFLKRAVQRWRQRPRAVKPVCQRCEINQGDIIGHEKSLWPCNAGDKRFTLRNGIGGDDE